MVINNYKQLIVEIVLLSIIVSCTATAKQLAPKQQLIDVPDGGRLHERIQSLYQAEKENDWETWFSIAAPTAPALEDKGPKEFQEEMSSEPREFSIVSWRVIGIELLDVSQLPPEVDVDGDAAVSINMDILIDRQGVQEREKDQTDYWIHINGEWYWYFR